MARLLVTLGLLALMPAGAAAEHRGDRYTRDFFPQGVRHPKGKVVYVTGPKDGILALRLRNGKEIWSTFALVGLRTHNLRCSARRSTF